MALRSYVGFHLCYHKGPTISPRLKILWSYRLYVLTPLSTELSSSNRCVTDMSMSYWHFVGLVRVITTAVCLCSRLPTPSQPVITCPMNSRPMISRPMISRPMNSRPMISRPMISCPMILRPIMMLLSFYLPLAPFPLCHSVTPLTFSPLGHSPPP
jgi:hypothetical protein